MILLLLLNLNLNLFAAENKCIDEEWSILYDKNESVTSEEYAEIKEYCKDDEVEDEPVGE